MRKRWMRYSLFLLTVVLVLIGCTNDNETEKNYTTEVNQELIDQHDNTYEEIITDFENGKYTLENPSINLDPYNRAPLSAFVLFETDEPSEITVAVEGQTEDTAMTHTYEGFETYHEIPVLGLYPNMENQVTLTAVTPNVEEEETTFTIETDPVPDDMLDFTLEVSQPELMEKGLTFVSPSRVYPTGLDHEGEIRWYTSVRSSNLFKRIDNGNVLVATKEEGREEYDSLIEMDMLGRVHQAIQVPMDNVIKSAPMHHDTIVLPNDNYLVLLHDGGDEYIEDEIAELDRETGEVVNRINLKDVFPEEMYEEYDRHQAEEGDWVHVNAVWMMENEEAILLSVRNQDMILRLSYPDGEIDWILGAPEGWHEDVEGYVLESTDEDIKYPQGQHAVMEMPDQDENKDTVDIMLFDNNRMFTRGNEDVDREYSRAVQYRINEEEQTVEEIWSYGEERGNEFYSHIVSDADYLSESNNVLITSGRVWDELQENRYSIISEVTRTEEPELVYEIHYGPFDTENFVQIYRAERMSLYPEN